MVVTHCFHPFLRTIIRLRAKKMSNLIALESNRFLFTAIGICPAPLDTPHRRRFLYFTFGIFIGLSILTGGVSSFLVILQFFRKDFGKFLNGIYQLASFSSIFLSMVFTFQRRKILLMAFDKFQQVYDKGNFFIK